MHYLYLFIDLMAISVPLIYSFHRKINFYKKFYAAIPAILLTALLFIGWDIVFTRWGIWGFNPTYVTGAYLYNLPVEEVLFFICIPYACLFTYYTLSSFYKFQWNETTERVCCLLAASLLLIVGFIYWDSAYTVSTFLSTAALLVLFKFVLKVTWTGRLFSIYPVLLIPFFIVNGILTGTGLDRPVVWYNDAENMGIRLHTIPIEDVVYGFELIMLNVFLFERLRRAEK